MSHGHYGVIFVAALVRFVIGWLWYSVLFGSHWQDSMKELKKDLTTKNMQKALFFDFCSTLLLSLIFCHFTYLVDVATFRDGAVLGSLIWLGFVFPTNVCNVIWNKETMRMYAIRGSYDLITLVLMGGILAQWS